MDKLAGFRTKGRLALVQGIYSFSCDNSFIPEKYRPSLTTYEKLRKFDFELFKDTYNFFSQNIVQIDDLISSYLAEDWRINRLDLITLSILRSSIAEMTYNKEIPTAILINEYIEIAKDFDVDAKFINGILHKISTNRENLL